MNQTALMQLFSERNNHPYENGLPKIDVDDLTRYNRTKVEIEDQWASHPETHRRIEMIRRNTTKNRPENNELAKTVIRGYDEIGKIMTDKYLTLNNIKNVGEVIGDNERFMELYNEQYPLLKMSLYFNSYYENHNPVLDNVDNLFHTSENLAYNELFSDEMLSLIQEKNATQTDLFTLHQIAADPKLVKTFKYNGTLYKSKNAGKVIPALTKELDDLKSRLEENDKQIFRYYYSLAHDGDKEILKNKYIQFASLDREYDIFEKAIDQFIPSLKFMLYTLPVEEIRKHRYTLLRNEKPFKDSVRQFLEESAYKDLLTIENKELLKNFIQSEYIYFNNDRYIQKEVDAIFTFINEYRAILNKSYTDYKEQLIDFQASIKEEY
jgi:hypothetical protein